MANVITFEQFTNDMTNIIESAIKMNVNCSEIANVICKATGMKRENALKLIACVGVKMNMAQGADYQTALDYFFDK